MDRLDPIVAFNNKGCRFLAMGRHDDAVGQFKTALMHLRCALHENQTTSTDCGALLSTGLRPLHWNDFQCLESHLKVGSTFATRLLQPAHSHYVTFSLAIPMLPGYTFSSHASVNERIYTAIVVFNLGLTLHLRALQCCSSSVHNDLLQKAKSLYSRTYQLIVPMMDANLWQHCHKNGQPSNNVALDLLIVGLLNNTALIHLELSEHIACKMAFQRLMQYVKISSLRRLLGAGACTFHPGPSGGGSNRAGRGGNARTMTFDNNQVHWQQDANNFLADRDGPDEEDTQEESRRMHMLMGAVVNEMILNATYVPWNVMVAPAAAA